MLANDTLSKFTQLKQKLLATNYGQALPAIYDDFFRVWGFFDTLLTAFAEDQFTRSAKDFPNWDLSKEWQLVNRFALEPKFRTIWNNPNIQAAAQNLASMECVGDAQNQLLPASYLQQATHTLRLYFGVDERSVCRGPRCEARLRKVTLCRDRAFTRPLGAPKINTASLANYDPFAATLSIVYQVKCNLFFAVKDNKETDDLERNVYLLTLCEEIIKHVLIEFRKLDLNQSTA